MDDAMDLDGSGPRGTKRKLPSSAMPPTQAPKRIKALDQDVVNKIAAGEIIVAPMHALKELIENAVDAGSTSLEIVVKEGGLKLLQITDNGHGINKDDLAILCERFTTSKLKAFEDLTSIGTYGFRGEALASISHIAHLTVTTKTADSSCAWRAHYADGKLAPAKPGQSADPKPCAGRGGTQITVEDLFYNIHQRRRAFKSSSEEYAKILDVVGRYAIHCAQTAFSCKKYGESAASISTSASANAVDRIRQIHGSAVANELIPFSVSDATRYGFKADGWTTNANYHVKRTTLLLFINHRAVESSAVKKAIDQTYSPFLPKGGHPFLYLSLDIEPHRVDVNVHPTKREVNFLHEDEIIDLICNAIRDALSAVDTSRTFTTQTLLPGTKIPTISSSTNRNTTPAAKPSSGTQSFPQTPRQSPAAVNPATLVRTDSKARKITSMLPPSTTNRNGLTSPAPSTVPLYTVHPDAIPTSIRLTSMKALRASVRASMHSMLTTTFASHTYVGLVDCSRRIAAMQSGIKLYLVDYGMASNEYFYQVGLTDFGNFGRVEFATPLDIRELVGVAVQGERRRSARRGHGGDAGMDWDEIPERIARLLVDKREMLAEYFAMHVSEDGQLEAIPLLLKAYMPSMAKLPEFLMNLGPRVDWGEEEACFRTFLVQLASFHAVEKLPEVKVERTGLGKGGKSEKARGKERADRVADEGEQEGFVGEGMEGVEGVDGNAGREGEEEEAQKMLAAKREDIARVLEHVLFPAMKARLVATRGLLKGVIEVADLKGLYRVFERC